MVLSAFVALGVGPAVLRALEAMGFEEPTPVQDKTIPAMLAGRDVIVQAQTGTGKTAAYGVPIAQLVDAKGKGVQALVLSPTRELALQVAEALNKMGKQQGVTAVPVYGGQAYGHQRLTLKQGAQVIVATPGRLLDLVSRKTIDLTVVKVVVIDEADEMLAMGFIEDVEKILEGTPAGRQTALFSATMRREILALADKHMHTPERIILTKPRALTVATVVQSYYVVPRPSKSDALLRILDAAAPKLALVFCATKQMTADLATSLKTHGYQAEALHGDMAQVQRESVMAAIRKGRIEILVATDVAARGLDVPEITHVINFDIPFEPDRYVHRIGRTARAGRVGEAISLISPQEFSLLRAIETTTGNKIARKELPTVAEMENQDRARLITRLKEALEGEEWRTFRTVLQGMAEQHDPLDLAAAALALAMGPLKQRSEIPRVAETQARPGSRTAFAGKPRFGAKPSFGAKPRFADRAAAGDPAFADKPVSGEKTRFAAKASSGEKPRSTAKPAFGAKPTYVDRFASGEQSSVSEKPRPPGKPAYGEKPRFGDKPKFVPRGAATGPAASKERFEKARPPARKKRP